MLDCGRTRDRTYRSDQTQKGKRVASARVRYLEPKWLRYLLVHGAVLDRLQMWYPLPSRIRPTDRLAPAVDPVDMLDRWCQDCRLETSHRIWNKHSERWSAGARSTKWIQLRPVLESGRTNRRNTGKISADRSTKTTLMLTIPGCN